MGRTLAIGDVHGCLGALRRLWEVVAPTADDRVVFLGDYVDRGPDSKGVVDFVLALFEDFDVTCLTGNHEEKMVLARDDPRERAEWIESWGGHATVASYGPGGLAAVPPHHWEFLQRELLYVETDTHIFVHAGVEADVALPDQSRLTLLRRKLGSPRPHRSGKIVVCGHTAQKSHRPLDLGHTVCIDTDPDRGGWLTCLDVESGAYWQTDQARRQRTGTIEEAASRR